MSGHFQPLKSARIMRKIKDLAKPSGEQWMINRNPRNLEKLRIAYKPSGYHLERPDRSYWHKLELNASGRYVTAEVQHFQNGPVVSASTSEWAIKKQLYKTRDTPAFVNLARVLAMRCLQCGINEITCYVNSTPGSKVEKFLETMREGGVSLNEPERFQPALPWSAGRPEKPWEVLDDQQQQAPTK